MLLMDDAKIIGNDEMSHFRALHFSFSKISGT